MAQLSYSQSREAGEQWIAKVGSWIDVTGEVLLCLKYIYNSPCMEYAFVHSSDELRKLVEQCPRGTELRAFRAPQFEIRGVLDSQLLELIRRLPDGHCYDCVFTTRRSADDLRLEGTGCSSGTALASEIEDRIGEPVAVGVSPNGESISAAKDGVDGPR